MQRRMALFISGKDDWLERHPATDLDGWRAYLHSEFEWELQHMCWMPLVVQIHQLVLQHLEVNVQNCFCPCGCFDQQAWAIGWLCDWEVCPEVLVVSGTRTPRERAEIRAIVENPYRDVHPELRFERNLDKPMLEITDA
jgi:hypothetical protein